jgi:flagella synthesis protein FlgN
LKPSSGPQLLSALAAEHAALLNFVALLEREQGMLTGNLTDQLLELSEQKSADALSLNELAEARRSLLRKNLPQLGAEAIHTWLGTHRPQGLAVWQEILALAERAQQLNQTNGELIQMKLRRNQQLLAVLSNAVNKANLYGPDGQASFSPGSGRSLGSG